MVATETLPVQALDLPIEAWCKTLSFMLSSSQCLEPVCAINKSIQQFTSETLSWEGSSVCICPDDLRMSNDHARFEALVLRWTLCNKAFLNFAGAHAGAKRLAAERCFIWLATECARITSLCVRNWCMFERSGLAILKSRFPQLQHLELSGCDQISTYEAMIPVFKEHPTLLTLRATFQPRAAAGHGFAAAAPPSLMCLGFVNFESSEVLKSLLGRCHLQHLWFSANGSFTLGMATALSSGTCKLVTLALPSEVTEEKCAEVAKGCLKLELLCRMKIGRPTFGSAALASEFEILPSGQGVVVRRRGSHMELAANGALWAPYSQSENVVASSLLARSALASATKSLAHDVPEEAIDRKDLAISASTVAFCKRTEVATQVAAQAAAAAAARNQ